MTFRLAYIKLFNILNLPHITDQWEKGGQVLFCKHATETRDKCMYHAYL